MGKLHTLRRQIERDLKAGGGIAKTWQSKYCGAYVYRGQWKPWDWSKPYRNFIRKVVREFGAHSS